MTPLHFGEDLRMPVGEVWHTNGEALLQGLALTGGQMHPLENPKIQHSFGHLMAIQLVFTPHILMEIPWSEHQPLVSLDFMVRDHAIHAARKKMRAAEPVRVPGQER